MKRSGYLRQRRGELDHHGYFGERSSAYLTYSHMRLLADHRTGQVRISAADIAAGTGMSLKVVRTDLAWLNKADPITGRPRYIEQQQKGNQHFPTLWLIVKYPVVGFSATPADGAGDDRSSTPTGIEQQGSSTPTGAQHMGCSTPTGAQLRRNDHTPQRVTTLNKKEKKKDKNPSTEVPRRREDAGGFDRPLGLSLQSYPHTKPFAARLASAVYLGGRFSTRMMEFLVGEVVPGFNARRVRPNASIYDFMRYGEKRMIGLLRHECSKGIIRDEVGVVLPDTKRYEAWLDHYARDPWRRVKAIVIQESKP